MDVVVVVVVVVLVVVVVVVAAGSRSSLQPQDYIGIVDLQFAGGSS